MFPLQQELFRLNTADLSFFYRGMPESGMPLLLFSVMLENIYSIVEKSRSHGLRRF